MIQLSSRLSPCLYIPYWKSIVTNSKSHCVLCSSHISHQCRLPTPSQKRRNHAGRIQYPLSWIRWIVPRTRPSEPTMLWETNAHRTRWARRRDGILCQDSSRSLSQMEEAVHVENLPESLWNVSRRIRISKYGHTVVALQFVFGRGALHLQSTEALHVLPW